MASTLFLGLSNMTALETNLAINNLVRGRVNSQTSVMMK